MRALKGNKYQGLLDMMLGGKAPKYGNNGLYSSSVDVNFDLPEKVKHKVRFENQ